MISRYSICNGEKHFSTDGLQKYLAFISTRGIHWISKDGNDGKIESWKSTGIWKESIKNLHTSDIGFAPKVTDD